MKPSSALLAKLAGLDELDDDLRAVAEGLIIDALGRPLWEAEHQATLVVRSVPAGSPVTTFDPVTSSPPTDVDVFDGHRTASVIFPPATPLVSIDLAGASVRDSVSAWVPAQPGDRIAVTYVGGWSASNAPTPVLLAVAHICALLTPATDGGTDPLPAELAGLLAAGATRVQVADQSIAFSSAGTSLASRSRASTRAEIDEVVATLRPYRWKLG